VLKKEVNVEDKILNLLDTPSTMTILERKSDNSKEVSGTKDNLLK